MDEALLKDEQQRLNDELVAVERDLHTIQQQLQHPDLPPASRTLLHADEQEYRRQLRELRRDLREIQRDLRRHAHPFDRHGAALPGDVYRAVAHTRPTVAPPPAPAPAAPPRRPPTRNAPRLLLPPAPVVALALSATRTPTIATPDGAFVLPLVLVPAGAFLLGNTPDEPYSTADEYPRHRLHLPTFYIARTPLTNAQFRPFVVGDGYRNPRYWTHAGWLWKEATRRTQPYYWDSPRWNSPPQPVVGLSWYEAIAYVRWLAAATGDDYRLPSEAEWEKAARGTDGRRYPWGNHPPTSTLSNYADTVGCSTPVGRYPGGASPYGVLDMVGNVWEWTRTHAGYAYPYCPDDGREKLTGDGQRVLRGGSWHSDRASVRCAKRFWHFPDFYGLYYNFGMRVLLVPRDE